MSENITLKTKLLEAQKEIGAITKDKVNPYFKSKYADINDLLEIVKPILNKHGLILTQPLEDTKLTTVIANAEGTDEIRSSVILPTNPDPQKMGSIITYFRRYSLQSLLALQAEDDDGNLASGKNGEHKEPKSDKSEAIEKTFTQSRFEQLIGQIKYHKQELFAITKADTEFYETIRALDFEEVEDIKTEKEADEILQALQNKMVSVKKLFSKPAMNNAVNRKGTK